MTHPVAFALSVWLDIYNILLQNVYLIIHNYQKKKFQMYFYVWKYIIIKKAIIEKILAVRFKYDVPLEGTVECKWLISCYFLIFREWQFRNFVFHWTPCVLRTYIANDTRKSWPSWSVIQAVRRWDVNLHGGDVNGPVCALFRSLKQNACINARWRATVPYFVVVGDLWLLRRLIELEIDTCDHLSPRIEWESFSSSSLFLVRDETFKGFRIDIAETVLSAWNIEKIADDSFNLTRIRTIRGNKV